MTFWLTILFAHFVSHVVVISRLRKHAEFETPHSFWNTPASLAALWRPLITGRFLKVADGRFAIFGTLQILTTGTILVALVATALADLA
ncbi:MAG: hypothetical protein ABW220_10625 [Burkholderiaceae bacterium]